MSQDPDNKIDKQFGLTTLSLNNRVTVYVLTTIIVVLGIMAYVTLPKEAFPDVVQPIVYVSTIHPGNSPEDMENLITRPIEKEINAIASVDNIKSTSVQDYSAIIVEFNTETDPDKALQEVKDAVDKAKSELPTDLRNDPNVFKFSFAENFPILNINLTSPNLSLEELKEYAEYLEEEIEKFSEVSKVEITGVDDREVRISADPYKMEARQVSFADIENAISSENITMSGGNILTDGIRRNVRIVGEFEDPSLIEDIIIKNEDNDIVYLRDVATVSFDYVETETYARLDLNPVVKVDVMKRSGENLLNVTDKILLLIKDAKENYFPADLKVTITNDQSKDTRDQVSSLGNNIISGVILVVLVLLFFLGTRNALFVGMAIPLSMFMALMILGALGISINTMTLFSLIMALGMLVDNGIVVVENVYRLMEEGLTPMEATKKGVGEVALPIISSTATTLAAFLPLAFWPGIFGEFMKYLPITLIITLGSSLFVALVINPVFISEFMVLEKDEKPNKKRVNFRSIVSIMLGAIFILIYFLSGNNIVLVIGNLLVATGVLVLLNVYVLTSAAMRFQEVTLPRLEDAYERTLKYALHGKRPLAFLGGTIFMFFFSFVLLGLFTPKIINFPINEPMYANVFIEFPVGTDIETTNEYSKKVEAKVMEIIRPYGSVAESMVTNVSKGAADPQDPSAVGRSDEPNKARVTVNFIPNKERGGVSTSEILNKIREGVKPEPGVTITVDKDASGPPAGKPINIEISGDDFTTLVALTEKVKNKINESGIEGIERLKSNLESAKPEVTIHIDRDKARRFGLSTYSVSNEIRTALFGKEISKYKEGEEDYKIQLRLDDEYRYNMDALLNKEITFRNQSNGQIVQVPISAVANVDYGSSYGSINRIDLTRVVTLSSNVLGGYNPTEINNQLKELLSDMELPKGYTVSFTGEQEKQAENMDFLSKALLFAVFMIFLIIVAQFNKLTGPFIIMTSVVFSTIGVFLGLIIFQMDFVIIMTMIGIISLAGIVVNNAIVLIDFIELTRKRKREELGVDILPMHYIIESIELAGKTRLRPVILTAVTTVLGLIPLALGINIDFIRFFYEYNADFYVGGDNVIFWGPMSWTIIFGLTFATFLTLVIVPVTYLIAEKVRYRLGGNTKINLDEE
ncbi:efflux RND transporter permease subunit [Cytophagales bacterium LB-30]|uniref:Efflux RND transporter permease subunit n=1 Tax=Shiella aurantiaca TaxID=3058365 RepID=A0ABT8F357_9BACT|nr:efflux RND transporter permease subunit [Shiella aurantiaca]MDN4164890.1 efflux RND transporter permease subunit [Shiella aurantiaca]